jgi:hypothetical protein
MRFRVSVDQIVLSVAVIGLTRRVNDLREEGRSSLADEFYNGVKCSNWGVQTKAFGVREEMTLQLTGRFGRYSS